MIYVYALYIINGMSMYYQHQSKCNIVSKVLFIKQKDFALLVLILLLKNILHIAFNTLFIVNVLFFIGFIPEIINYMILIILKCILFYISVLYNHVEN